MEVIDVIGKCFLLFGCLLILLAGIGILRFTHVFARMHAAAKAPTLGISLVAIGVSMTVRTAAVTFTVLLVVILQFVTGPVGAHLLGRAVYRKTPSSILAVDDLAEDRR